MLCFHPSLVLSFSDVGRCGDTVPSTVYGFLPFQAIIDLIPKNQSISTIFILTDPSARASILSDLKDIKFSHNCHPILMALYNRLRIEFPQSYVILKSGGDPFVDYLRLSRAKITICSASTFCLWPAIASVGVAHFPVTGLIAGWNSERMKVSDLPSFVTSEQEGVQHFKWIDQPRIVTSFKDSTSAEEAIRVLSSATG